MIESSLINSFLMDKSNEIYDYEKVKYLPLNNLNELLNNLKDVNLLPFNQGKIFFKSNLWDFSQVKMQGLTQKGKKINFEKCPERFKDILKVYVLIRILEDKVKIQTILGNTQRLIKFLKYADNQGCITLNDITSEMMIEFINSLNSNVRNKNIYRTTIRQFYEIFSMYFDNINTPEIKNALANKNQRLIKGLIEENKTENIPDEYYRKFIHVCKDIVINESEEDWIRGVASVYLILSQTGLRINECLALTIDCLKTTTHYDGHELSYILYSTSKRVRGLNGIDTVYTYANDISILAINTLIKLDLYCSRRESLGVKYLFMGGQNEKENSYFPLDSAKYSKLVESFFVHINEKFKTVNLPEGYYPGIKNKRIWNVRDVKTIALPKTAQFRVHVVTELLEKGVHIKYVQKFMSHLTKEMTSHYVRPKVDYSSKQQEIENSKKTLESILTNKEKLIGKGSAEWVEIVEKFIKNNKFNIAKNLDEIIEGLLGKYPIKQKVGGYLIAPINLRGKTKKDSYTDMYLEKYGFETTGLTFYFMIPKTYKHVKNQIQIVQYNLDNGFTKEAKVELDKLKNTITDLFEPELKELENQLDANGLNILLQSHPELLEIIDKISEIKKEINKWKTFKI